MERFVDGEEVKQSLSVHDMHTAIRVHVKFVDETRCSYYMSIVNVIPVFCSQKHGLYTFWCLLPCPAERIIVDIGMRRMLDAVYFPPFIPQGPVQCHWKHPLRPLRYHNFAWWLHRTAKNAKDEQREERLRMRRMSYAKTVEPGVFNRWVYRFSRPILKMAAAAIFTKLIVKMAAAARFLKF